MVEKLKSRTIRLTGPDRDAATTESAAALLRDVVGVLRVHVIGPHRLKVSYNVRQVTMQIIEALLREFGYHLNTGFFCSLMRSICYYIEDIECTESKHDQADCTREAFIKRYLERPHGCRDHRPDYMRRYL